MDKVNKISNITLNYQRDLDITLVAISEKEDPTKVRVLQLDNAELADLYHQVSETFDAQQGKLEQQTIDVLNPNFGSVKQDTEEEETFIKIPSKLYQEFSHLDLRYRKLQQEKRILLAENKRLKQKQN